MKIIFFIFVFILSIHTHTQIHSIKSINFKNVSVSSSLSAQNLDLFNLNSIDFTINKINFSASVGCGLNRTFYQKNFFPQIQLGLSYLSLRKSILYLGPEITGSFSTLKVQEQHYFSSLGLGYFFKYGNKWVLLNRINIGVLHENFINVLNKTNSSLSFNYQVSVGLGYVLD